MTQKPPWALQTLPTSCLCGLEGTITVDVKSFAVALQGNAKGPKLASTAQKVDTARNPARIPAGTTATPSCEPDVAMMKSSASILSPQGVQNASCVTPDYGFAGSWDYRGPLPASPGDVAARVMAAAAEVPGASPAEGDDGKGEHAASHAPVPRPTSTSGVENVSLVRHHSHLSSLPSPRDINDEARLSPNVEGVGHGDDNGQFQVGHGVDDQAHSFDGSTGDLRLSRQEQVSLPEDIYGAARVSEYWHGMHALSSLASAYVYDDIWAGDGLTTR